jgi:hypothetical protein
MNQHQILEQLLNIFFPYATKQRNRMKEQNKRLVHYTSAQAAMNIISNKEIWFRQSSCMNDHSEILHGRKCLFSAFHHPDRIFQKALDTIYPNLSNKVAVEFDALVEKIQDDIYLLCVSEHENSEDFNGRLSMWRAYGKGNGVAIVMNPEPFHKDTDAFKAYTTPVAYMDPSDFLKQLDGVANSIISNQALLKRYPEQNILNMALVMLRFAMVATKHSGFSEEQEWRVIYKPTIEQSEHMQHAVVDIGGVPQEIYKLPIKNIPSAGVDFLDMNKVINRIIIGPTQYPTALNKAFIDTLTKAGVANAQNKVVNSGIPLRS